MNPTILAAHLEASTERIKELEREIAARDLHVFYVQSVSTELVLKIRALNKQVVNLTKDIESGLQETERKYFELKGGA